jgi:argininosuccinate lyase
MPQKRNPVSLEHARAICSKALGQAMAIVTSVHNTPFGDIVDTEDDLQPLVFSMFRDAVRTLRLVSAAMRTAEFDAARLEARAGDGWTTLTELADTLVRDHAMPFQTAHAIAGRFIAAHATAAKAPLAQLLSEVSVGVWKAPIHYSEEALATILSPRHFVSVRRTWGGPAPEETARAAQVSRAHLESDEKWRRETTDALRSAEARLRGRSASL